MSWCEEIGEAGQQTIICDDFKLRWGAKMVISLLNKFVFKFSNSLACSPLLHILQFVIHANKSCPTIGHRSNLQGDAAIVVGSSELEDSISATVDRLD